MASSSSNNRHVVDGALSEFADGLRPFVTNRTGLIVETDPSALIRLMLDRWDDAFHAVLGYHGKNLLYEIRDVRNDWAHNRRAFTDDDTDRCLDSIERLLDAAGATTQSTSIKGIKEQRRRVRYGGSATGQPSVGTPDRGGNIRSQFTRAASYSQPVGTAYNVSQASRAVIRSGYVCSAPPYGTRDAQVLARLERGDLSIKVRCPGRVSIQSKYLAQDLYVCFPVNGSWFLVPHDDLVLIAGETTPWLDSHSWRERGGYSSASPSKRMLARLEPYSLTALR